MYESEKLTPEALEELEQIVASKGVIRGIKHARESYGLEFAAASLLAQSIYRKHHPPLSLEEQETTARDKLQGIEADGLEKIVASWDGDSVGWMVVLEIVKGGQNNYVAKLQAPGGDFRVFQGEVPPWPEADVAERLGLEFAEKHGVPFLFPNRDHPKID